MIEISYDNSDIEALLARGKSGFLKRFPKKKALLKVLKSFYAILEVIQVAKDLLHYQSLKYKAGTDCSFVQLKYGGQSCILVFSEQELGRKITIKDLKI